MTNLVKGNLPVEIYGNSLPTPDGTCLRDYVDVRDIAKAHVSVANILESPIPLIEGLEFNLGSESPISVLEVAREIYRAFGRGTNVVYGEQNPADPVAVWSDSTRARIVLNWAPEYSLKESIESHVVHPHHA
jgi:UDP-glucose 4-epimerase